MSSRTTNKSRKGKMSKKEQEFERTFSPSKYQNITFSRLNSVPDKACFCIPTAGIYVSAAATASASCKIAVSSLLTTLSNYTTSGQSTYLPGQAALYENYRVVKFDIDIEWFARATTARTLLTAAPYPTDPAYSVGVAFDWGATTMPRSQFHVLPGLNGSPNHGRLRTASVKIQDIVGSPAIYTDDKYLGAITSAGVFTSPTDGCDFAVHMAPEAGGVFTAGDVPALKIFLTQYVEFVNRRAG